MLVVFSFALPNVKQQKGTDCSTAAHGEVAELLRQGAHHRGRLDGHGVVHSRSQDGSL